MNSALLYLLVAISSSNSSPSTLAVLNDARSCAQAANALQTQSKERSGSGNIYAYCVPVPRESLVTTLTPQGR